LFVGISPVTATTSRLALGPLPVGGK